MHPRASVIGGVLAAASLLITAFAAHASAERELPGHISPGPSVPVTNAAESCTPGWVPTFGNVSSVTSSVLAFTVFDDGDGPALYVGGRAFTGGGATNRVRRWDGGNWSLLDGGLTGTPLHDVSAFAVFDDGSGPALYAGGAFSHAGGVAVNGIAKWNGSEWLPLGAGIAGGTLPAVRALAVFDDGTGPALYAGGLFTSIGGTPARHIAKWDGSTWSSLGDGLSASVRDLMIFDDGSGPALYAGGFFLTASGVTVNCIAKWDGATWSPLSSGVNNAVFALEVFDDGTGAALYAAGLFTSADGSPASRVAKWNGMAWSTLGEGVSGPALSLKTFDDGSGQALYIGGQFTAAGGASANRIARWDGHTWATLNAGVNSTVEVLAAFDDGSGAKLIAGGGFSQSDGTQILAIGQWDGSQWLPVGRGLTRYVHAITGFDDGDGPALYVGGEMSHAGQQRVNRIAKWSDGMWSPLGAGMNDTVRALTIYEGTSRDRPDLYAAGAFTTAGGAPAQHIARWDGASWSALGSGLSGSALALGVFDDGEGPALYAGGVFTSAGGVTVNSVARWDGETWAPLANGLSRAPTNPPTAPEARAFAVFDDGAGPALYVGGIFDTAGGVPARNIAKWDGAAWSSLGAGLDGAVYAMCVFDDGSGPALYAGGSFTIADGAPASRIAKWNGTHWSSPGADIEFRYVNSLALFDDGSGPALYAAGDFRTAAGVDTPRIARWDGLAWSSVFTGTSIGPYWALTVFDDGAGDALYAGGAFSNLIDTPDSYIAKWQGCPATSTPCPGDTNADGVINFSDLNAVLGQFGADVPPGSGGDVTGDGLVNFSDLNEVLTNFGNSCD